MKQLALDFAITTLPTLGNFVEGRNGELAQRLRGLVGGAERERCVYVWGPTGCGRTHLLKATVGAMASAGARAAYMPCDRAADWPEALEHMNCVALDDVDSAGQEVQRAAFKVYNALRDHDGVILAAGGV